MGFSRAKQGVAMCPARSLLLRPDKAVALLNQTSTLLGYFLRASVFVVRIKVLSGGTREVKCLRFVSEFKCDNNFFW